MNRKRRRAIAVLSAAALQAGCFTYVPTRLADVRAGQEVQIHLTPRAQVELSQQGSRVEEAVQGVLSSRQNNTLLLKIPIGTQQAGFFRSNIERDLSIAEPDVLGIDLRQFSPSRTALLVGGATGGAALLIVTIIAASRNPSGTGDPDPEELRIQLLRLPAR
ncbi:MAG: hypothetical protein EXR95_09335 [Gemmatimonadetes bacterium]|nr:hypothetical protein [Gemmatimonadota bacterium]